MKTKTSPTILLTAIAIFFSASFLEVKADDPVVKPECTCENCEKCEECGGCLCDCECEACKKCSCKKNEAAKDKCPMCSKCGGCLCPDSECNGARKCTCKKDETKSTKCECKSGGKCECENCECGKEVASTSCSKCRSKQ